jgi:hypothetical protein
MTGFDVEDIYREHAFLVRIPKSAKDSITVHEVFGGPPKPEDREWRPETVLRAELSRPKWDMISGELRSELNRRLRDNRRKTGRWSLGDNPVQRLLGKELLVLACPFPRSRRRCCSAFFKTFRTRGDARRPAGFALSQGA